jgi:hypothetical protein
VSILNYNFILNSPVTYHDVMTVENNFDPDVGSLKGKAVQQTPDSI